MKKFMTAIAMMAVLAFAAPSFAATNPFMDVPQGHWAYDAVAFLASRGVVSGYPDGAYKGAQPATRYEMASVVARALANVDAEKASKQDLEVLKKLVMEFKDELDALGVKVDKIDKRVAVLEKNIGGWKLSGQMYFDAKFWGGDATAADTADRDLRSFGFGRARLFLGKQIDDFTSLTIRINAHSGSAAAFNEGSGATMTIDRWFVDTKLGGANGLDFRFGRFNFDWEGDAGLYDPYAVNNDALYGDLDLSGFQFSKTWGVWNVTALVGRNLGKSFNCEDTTLTLDNSWMLYGLRVAAKGEKWQGGLLGYWLCGDNGKSLAYYKDGQAITGNDGNNVYTHQFSTYTYGVYAGYKFTPAVELKGIYYWQNINHDNTTFDGTDTPKAWKAILDVKQDALKFTGLWIEYGEEDANFVSLVGDAMYDYGMGSTGANKAKINGGSKVKNWNATADQKWNDKWSTYLRWTCHDFTETGVDSTSLWALGVRYQYTPAIQFKLEFAQVNYGTNAGWNEANPDNQMYSGKENLLRFRTTVNF